jgi:hypothetical protein
VKPLRLSWSQLRNHEECHQKSFLIRGGKRPKVTNIRSYFHGMVVDRVMRDWLNNPLRTSGEMILMVGQLIDVVEQEAKDTGDGIVHWRDAQDRTHLAAFCVELVRRLEPILQTIVLPYRHEAATRFAAPVLIPDLTGADTQITLVGETDLTVFHDDGLQVWDLKGTKDNTYWRKVLGQLYFYDIAMLAVHGTRTERVGLIQPMCDDPVLQFVITDDDRTCMWARIVAMAHDIWREEQTCKADTSGCSRCDVRHACPRFQVTDDLWSMPAALRAAAQEIS